MRSVITPLSFSITLVVATLLTPLVVSAQTATPAATPVSIVDLCNRALLEATPVAPETAVPADATFDLAYVDMLLIHHEQAIIMATIAVQLAEHPELAEFAARTIDERARGGEALLDWRASLYPDSPSLTAEQAIAIFDLTAVENPGRGGVPGSREIAARPDIDHLCAANPGEFDLEFIDIMTQHYVGALFLSRAATAYAESEEVGTFAGELAVSLQMDVDTLQAWRTLWYPDAGDPHSH